MDNKNIYQSLQELRDDKRLKGLKKSGMNKHLGFAYYELDDFLPIVKQLLKEYEMTTIFRVEVEANGIEYAYLTLIKGNEQIIFKCPTAEPSGNNPIQQLGSKLTYMRRYMYISLLDLTEQDSVEPNLDSNKKVDYATPGQIATIKANGKLIKEELMSSNIKTENDLKGLTREKASELISMIEERKNAKQD